MFKTVNYEIPKTAVLKRNTKQPQRRGFINLHVTHQPSPNFVLPLHTFMHSELSTVFLFRNSQFKDRPEDARSTISSRPTPLGHFTAGVTVKPTTHIARRIHVMYRRMKQW